MMIIKPNNLTFKLILSFLFFRNAILLCQNVNLRIDHYTVENGLSQNTVDCILQDSRGFMWFGTWNGLNKFDGYNFKTYKSDNKINSISNNFIYALCEDRYRNIWIGTKNGLNRLDYLRDKIYSYFHNENDSLTISGNNIRTIFSDHYGTLWIGTTSGLDRIDILDSVKYTLKITHIKLNLSSSEIINCIYEDRNNNFWIGTNDGLVLYLRDNNTSFYFRNDPQNIRSLANNNVLSIYHDKNGFLWVGTEIGLSKMDLKTSKFYNYFHNAEIKSSIIHNVINSITEDINGNILFGTLGGLDIYNQPNDNFVHFPVNKENDYALNNEFINSVYSDKQGNVWIGTDKGGVNKYNIYQKEFYSIVHDVLNSNSLSHSIVNSIYEDGSYLWIGTAGGGLNCYDKKNNKFIHYIYDPHRPEGISGDFISSILKDKYGNLWIGTWGNGINKMIYPIESKKFSHYFSSGNIYGLHNNYISTIYEDKTGFLLIGTLGSLELFYPDKNKFYRIAADIGNYISEVGCILKDKNNNYWIGTRIGLYKILPDADLLNLNDNNIIKYTNIPGDEFSLPDNYVLSICEGSDGTIWIGTYGKGFCKINIKNGKEVFITYNQEDGLSNNVVYSILEDNENNLWLSTDYGLSKFNPYTKTFRNFYITDGLLSNQFYWSAAFKGIDGKLFFGSMKGLNYFYPEKIKEKENSSKVILTDFKIFNNSVNVGKWNNKKTILKKIISETDEIKLSYKQNIFSIEFSALDYFLPEKIRYAYKMEGVDKEWVYVNYDRRFATYTNLKGGVYYFNVKATNSDGLWTNNVTKLKIIITPPFWETLWFKIIVFIFIVLITLLIFRLRFRAIKHQKEVLEKLVKERTQKIEEQNEELKTQAEKLAESNIQLEKRQLLIEGQKQQLEAQYKEIAYHRDKLIELNKHVQIVNQLRLRFFTNISHEFKTPLTLILNPLEKLINGRTKEEEVKRNILLAHRNAKRLLHLINQLMEFRKIEEGKISLKVSKGNITEFVNDIFTSFDQIAEQRKINYKLNIESGLPSDCWFDHEKLENVLYNLISNAFKYTPEYGKIEIILKKHNNLHHDNYNINELKNQKNINDIIEISVCDTGIGISKEHISNIFKRFYRINSPESYKVGGTGIGLSLTRDLIKACKGSINVESEQGKGSVFTIKFPVNKSFYNEDEIVSGDNLYKISIADKIEDLYQEINKIEKDDETLINNQNNNKPKILLVEDNIDLRMFLASCLINDYYIIEAGNGKEGYEAAKNIGPDLIVSDIMMPEIDGLELCSKIKEDIDTSHIPVILLTAKSSIEDMIEGLETGADDYVAKPFNIDILKARIKNIIENRKLLKQAFNTDYSIEPSKITSNKTDEEFLKKCISIVEENYKEPEFGVEEFVSKMFVSRSFLHKKLTALTGNSAGDFITSIRLKKSLQLLKQPNVNISEVAYSIGFNDPKYFTRVFKKNFGITPSDYIANNFCLPKEN
jgi:signal transduction histidine kinase/ligand-binding sensor domain-containing protein/DNA-binding response OmpR family regulator